MSRTRCRRIYFWRTNGELGSDIERWPCSTWNEPFNPLAEARTIWPADCVQPCEWFCSAIQAYMTLGSENICARRRMDSTWWWNRALPPAAGDRTRFCARRTATTFTRAWTKTHRSFETPCGAYAHFKLTRYLLRVTRDARYGDSMERVMYNTVLGAKPLRADGSTFYYSDYNFSGRKSIRLTNWACCSGTLPQVAADYRINTYFRDARGVYVNLYIPSTARWVQEGARVSLTSERNNASSTSAG